jgi:hypothetical protein
MILILAYYLDKTTLLYKYFFRILGDIQKLSVDFREKDAALQKELLEHQSK